MHYRHGTVSAHEDMVRADAMGILMLAALRRIGHAIAREIWRREIIPGKFPWAKAPDPTHPAYGTEIMRTNDLLIYADGVGGLVSMTLRASSRPRAF